MLTTDILMADGRTLTVEGQGDILPQIGEDSIHYHTLDHDDIEGMYESSEDNPSQSFHVVFGILIDYYKNKLMRGEYDTEEYKKVVFVILYDDCAGNKEVLHREYINR